MAHLFSPITIARTKLANRIVMAPRPSGHATTSGFVEYSLVDYYTQRAKGGVGLIITEPMRVVSTSSGQTLAHLGIYDDAFIPALRDMVESIHAHDTRIIAMLDAPPDLSRDATPKELRSLTEHFILAAWRVLAANFDGVMLSGADGNLLQSMISPLTNRRYDEYGRTIDGRLRILTDIVESIRQWMGKRLIIGFRLVAEEFDVGGITLQDARMIASRAIGAGVHLLDVTADTRNDHAQIARFPGWCIPLASSIKRCIPDTPVIGSGLLGEPHLADSLVREGSVDMVMLGNTLRTNPEWPNLARAFLVGQSDGVSDHFFS